MQGSYLLKTDKIRELLYGSRLPVDELANRLEMTQNTVRALMKGKILSPQYKTIKKLGAFYGVDPDELLDFVSPEEYASAKREAPPSASRTGRFVVQVVTADADPERQAEELQAKLNEGDVKGWRLVHIAHEAGFRLVAWDTKPEEP